MEHRIHHRLGSIATPHAWVPAGSGVGRNHHRTDSNKESPVLEGHPQDRAEKTRLGGELGLLRQWFQIKKGALPFPPSIAEQRFSVWVMLKRHIKPEISSPTPGPPLAPHPPQVTFQKVDCLFAKERNGSDLGE